MIARYEPRRAGAVHRLVAVVHAELGEEVAQVIAHAVGAEAEFGHDLHSPYMATQARGRLRLGIASTARAEAAPEAAVAVRCAARWADTGAAVREAKSAAPPAHDRPGRRDPAGGAPARRGIDWRRGPVRQGSAGRGVSYGADADARTRRNGSCARRARRYGTGRGLRRSTTSSQPTGGPSRRRGAKFRLTLPEISACYARH